MKTDKSDVIPALAGYFTVYDFGDEIALDDPVIAWRIETKKKRHDDEYFSICTPITVEGDAGGCIGVQNPDKTITVFGDLRVESLEELNFKVYPSKRNVFYPAKKAEGVAL
jgi:hypothetical protein